MKKPNIINPVELPTTGVTNIDKEIWKQETSTYVKRKNKLEENIRSLSSLIIG